MMRKGLGAGFRHGGLAILTAGLAAIGGCQSTSKPAPKGPLIEAPATCVDFAISIYFEPRSAAITHEAGQLISAAFDQTRGCDVTGVRVVGLADAPGSPDANLELSRRRAEAVTHAFHHRGLNTVEFQTTAAGEVGAQNALGQAGPLRRRAEVTFHLAPRPAPAR